MEEDALGSMGREKMRDLFYEREGGLTVYAY